MRILFFCKKKNIQKQSFGSNCEYKKYTKKKYIGSKMKCKNSLDFLRVFSILHGMISVHHTISKQKGVSLQRNIESFIGSKKKIVTFFTGKKRPVYLDKYIDAHKYRRDKNSRLAYFFTGIEILHRARKDHCTHRADTEWEILGRTQDNTIIAAHIREEKIGNDRILFLISIFEKT